MTARDYDRLADEIAEHTAREITAREIRAKQDREYRRRVTRPERNS
jgi:hypothetical protein